MTEDALHFERVQKRRERLDNEDMSEVIRNPKRQYIVVQWHPMMFAKLILKSLLNEETRGNLENMAR